MLRSEVFGLQVGLHDFRRWWPKAGVVGNGKVLRVLVSVVDGSIYLLFKSTTKCEYPVSFRSSCFLPPS